MPKYKQEPDEQFPDVWVVNDSGRVVAIPGMWVEAEDKKTGKKFKDYQYPQIMQAQAGQNGWRMASDEEIEKQKGIDAAKAEKDRADMKARAEDQKEAEAVIRAAKAVKKGKARE